MNEFKIGEIVSLKNSKAEIQYRISNIFDADVEIINLQGEVSNYAKKGELIIESIPHGVVRVTNKTELIKILQ